MVHAYPIRVGHIDLSFHAASAREVERVLVSHGHAIQRLAAPPEDMFAMLAAGDLDILVSAWLPASHGAYFAPIAAAVRPLTVLYEPYCIWGVPDHVPQDELANVTDLLKPSVLMRMERLIQGINAGAWISRFSQAMVTAYGLDAAGYHFRPGTEAECFDRFEAAARDGRWVILPLWHPQYLHSRHRIRALVEPLGLLGGQDKATLLLRRAAEARVRPTALAELERLHLGNDRVSMLDAALRNAT